MSVEPLSLVPRTARQGNVPAARPARIVSTDIFDTLLLRRPVSERRRLLTAAREFLGGQPAGKAAPPAELVCRARQEAQKMAYVELDVSGRDGEVRLEDILARQVLLLGLPHASAEALTQAELSVEKRSLRANTDLIAELEILRQRGFRVIGISDTVLSGMQLRELIDAVAGRPVLDAIYSSADLQASKRAGGIFARVMERERASAQELLHIGDDRHADVDAPRKLGVTCLFRPRSRLQRLWRGLDVVAFEVQKRFGKAAGRRRLSAADHPGGFGEHVLGPVMAEFCMRLWLYLHAAAQPPERPVVAFCARGGLNMRIMFDRFLARTGLPLHIAKVDFMVSRLAAARGAILRESGAAADELEREFSGSLISEVVRSLTDLPCELGPEWNVEFRAQTLYGLLRSTAVGRRIRDSLREQDRLFIDHLRQSAGECKRIILCDTGLYGSTLRLLQAGHPEYEWECVLFARCNYKSYAAPHFDKTAGLAVQSDGYSPLQPRTAILRYWHLIEALFEPPLESVRSFKRRHGGVLSNLEQPGWRTTLASSRSPALTGVLRYLDGLAPQSWFKRMTCEADAAWVALKSAIVFPDAKSVAALQVADRARDFGRDSKVARASPASDVKGRLLQALGSLWKEGSLARQFPSIRWFLLAGIETAYAARSAYVAIRRSLRR